MDANTYQLEARRTLIDIPDREIPQEDLELVYDIISLAVEVGKLVEYLKKAIFHQHGINHEIVADKLEIIDDMVWRGSPPIPKLNGQEIMKLWVLSGLIGEAAEIGQDILDEFETGKKPEEMSKELGDCQWYLTSLATQYGLSMNDVLIGNVTKLQKRYRNGYSSEASKNRQE